MVLACSSLKNSLKLFKVAKKETQDPLKSQKTMAAQGLSINSLKEFILELKRAGLSILITDHNYWAIENILDKAYIIKGGEILVEGTTEKISKDKNAIKYYLGGNFRF